MNRMNFGNVITNGAQILSVGATTAGQVFRDRADSSLINMTKEERVQYGKYEADLKRDKMNEYYEKNPDKKSVDTKNPEKKSVNAIEENSDQAKTINKRIYNDIVASDKYNIRFQSKETGRMVKLQDILKEKVEKGGNE